MEPNHSDRMDELLDAALKRYGAIEPRPGLEGRILANLRATESQPQRNRLWRPVAATCAAMLLLVGAVTTLRMDRFNAQQPSAHAVAPVSRDRRPEASSNQRGAHLTAENSATVVRTKPAHAFHRPPSAASSRREQFPSPEPLSEQEQILARYVEQFHREATLVARAQTELFQREASEREISPADRMTQDKDKDTDQQNP